MSFVCQGCNAAQPTGTSPKRTVTKIRTIGGGDEYTKAREEIAEEQNLCSTCAEPYEAAAAEKERLRYGTALAPAAAEHSSKLSIMDSAMRN